MERKLFIIGNGFDLAHKLKTDYGAFKKYIGDSIKECEGIPKDESYLRINDIPNASIPEIHYGRGEDSGVLADYNQEKKVIYWMIDDVSKRKNQIDWNEFETYLGKLDFVKVIWSSVKI